MRQTWDGASTFTTNAIVNFTNTGVGSVNIDAAGVTPSAVNVSNTTGTYVFQGGPIKNEQRVPGKKLPPHSAPAPLAHLRNRRAALGQVGASQT